MTINIIIIIIFIIVILFEVLLMRLFMINMNMWLAMFNIMKFTCIYTKNVACSGLLLINYIILCLY